MMKFANNLQTKSDMVRNMIPFVLTALFLFLLIVLQTTVVPSIAVFHVVPGVVFVFCICYSIKNGGLSSIIFSLICGFALDLLNGRPRGCDALFYMYISLGCMLIHDCLYNVSLKIIMLCTFTASVLYGAASFGVSFLLWGETQIGYAFLYKIVPESLYNTVMSPLLYLFVCRCTVHRQDGGRV